MNNDRLKFRTPYYLPNPDGINEFVGFAHWDAITGRPNICRLFGKGGHPFLTCPNNPQVNADNICR